MTDLRDPGDRWAEETLGPLRRQEVECDVAPRVMARIMAGRDAVQPLPVSPRAHGFAWASSLILAAGSLVFLVTTLVVMVSRGDEGVRQLAGLAASGWHVLLVVGRLIADLGAGVLADVLPILRKLRALLEVAAPLLRGAGMLAAACGGLSILFSSYVFASARKTAPRAGLQGGIS